MSDPVKEDKFTASWWRTQYEGVCHRMNEQSAQMARLEKRADAMSQRYDEILASENERDAVIGQLIERLDKAASEFSKLKKSVASLGAGQIGD
jgi:chromosome segregation ATPase